MPDPGYRWRSAKVHASSASSPGHEHEPQNQKHRADERRHEIPGGYSGLDHGARGMIGIDENIDDNARQVAAYCFGSLSPTVCAGRLNTSRIQLQRIVDAPPPCARFQRNFKAIASFPELAARD